MEAITHTIFRIMGVAGNRSDPPTKARSSWGMNCRRHVDGFRSSLQTHACHGLLSLVVWYLRAIALLQQAAAELRLG